MKNLHSHLSGKSHILWDWNGTLLNDVDLCVRTMSRLLTKHGLKAITHDDYRRHFRFPIIDYYRKLGFDFAATPFEKLGDDWIAMYKENLSECTLFEGTKDLLELLVQDRKTQMILTAARETEVWEQLRGHRIDHYFAAVAGLKDHYAAGKIERGHELLTDLRKQGVDENSCVLIGDTDHDGEVAEALGIECVLLGDGHQHPDYLSSLNQKLIPCRYTL